MSKKPKEKIKSKEMVDSSLQECVEFLKQHSITRFLLLFQPVDGLTTYHVENMQVNSVMQALVVGFQQTLDFELRAHPEYLPEHVDAIHELQAGFVNLINESNKRFEKFIKSVPQPKINLA